MWVDCVATQLGLSWRSQPRLSPHDHEPATKVSTVSRSVLLCNALPVLDLRLQTAQPLERLPILCLLLCMVAASGDHSHIRQKG